MIERDHVHQIEKLPLVFVHTLDLHVEQRRRIDANAVHAAQPPCELVFALQLHALPALTERGIVDVALEAAQLCEVAMPAIADSLVDQ